MKAAALYTVIAKLRSDLFMAKRHREAGSPEALRREASARELGKVAINLVNSMRLDEARPGNRVGELEALVFDLAGLAKEGSRLRRRAFLALGISEPLTESALLQAEQIGAIPSMKSAADAEVTSQDSDYFKGGIRLTHDMVSHLAVLSSAYSEEVLVLHRNPQADGSLVGVSVYLDTPHARFLDILEPSSKAASPATLHVVQP